jgi:hypothetical protein
MNAPISLRPAYDEAARIERRSWSRVLAATALGTSQRSDEKIPKANWPHDPCAATIPESRHVADQRE